MKLQQVFRATVAVLVLMLACSSEVGAEVVGRLSQVEGRVDLLKGGNLPANPVKVEDAVESKDVIRTKSLSKAQITFIDNSVINLSPESRIAIEEYHFDSNQGKRRAVVELFRGLAHVVVNKIFTVDNPDFIVKTHTAVTGVRGTDFGIRLSPNSSTILNFEGRTRVGNIFPEVHTWEHRAEKVAYNQAPGGGFFAPWSFVDLNPMQGTTVQSNLPPTLPYDVSPEDRAMFMRLMGGELLGRKDSGGKDVVTGPGGGFGPQGTGTGPGGNLLTTNVVADSSSLGLTTGTGNTSLTLVNTVTVPPTVVPQPQVQTQTQTQPSPPPPLSGVAIPVFNILTSWGAGATDLDLHLTGPQGASTFHVYYGSPGSLTSQPFALLNRDDTGTSGSEVITVQQFNQGGTYQVSVFNFGNSSTTSNNLSSSAGLSLTVINGGTVVDTSNGGSTVQGGTVVATLTPIVNQVGNTWYAVTIDPATGQITSVNQITNTNNGFAVNAAGAATATAGGTTTSLATPSTTPTPSVTSTASNTMQPASSSSPTRTSSTTLAAAVPTVTSTTTPSPTPVSTGTTSVTQRASLAPVNQPLTTRPGANVITSVALTTPLAAANPAISPQPYQAHRLPQLLRQPRHQVQPQRQPLPAANENPILSNGRR
jgi:hypothetical protein